MEKKSIAELKQFIAEREREIKEIEKELNLFQYREGEAKLDVPFVPSAEERVDKMIKLAGVTPGVIAADLGSGDGRIVVALAKAGAIATGFEIFPKRVWMGERLIQNEHLEDRARILEMDFFEADLSEFKIITVYGITSIMGRLETKLLRELSSGSKVISSRFAFPKWKPKKEIDEIYLYEKE